MVNNMCVANKQRYYKLDGKLDKTVAAKVLMSGCVVRRSFVESFNKDYESIGEFYEIDEEASKKFYVDFEAQNKARKEAEELKDQVSEALANTFKSVNEKVKKPKKEKDSE